MEPAPLAPEEVVAFDRVVHERIREGDKISFRRSLNLRKHRVLLLGIRDKLQHQVTSKYKNIRQLMAAFDKDGDGVVNKADWMWGLKEYNFPLSKDEANLLFSAIDEDGNGVLTYKEMVDILAPASLTTWASTKEAENLEERTAFSNFSKVQASKFAAGRPMTPGGTRLAAEPYFVDLPPSPRPFDTIQGRPPNSIAEEIQFLKDKVEKIICKGATDDTMLGRIAKFFRAADKDNKKYLTAHEFISLLSDGLLGIQLNDRERAIIAHEVADNNGAVDINSVAEFFGREYVPSVDAMQASIMRGVSFMKAAAAADAEKDVTFHSTLPPPPVDRYAPPAASLLLGPRHRFGDTQVGNPFRPTTSDAALGSGRSRPSTLESVRSGASGGGRPFAGPSSVHPLLTTQISKAETVEPRRVDPRVGRSSSGLPAFDGGATGDIGRATVGPSGLSASAHAVLNATAQIVPKRAESCKPSGVDLVSSTIRAFDGSPFFAPPESQFVTKSDPAFFKTADFSSTTGMFGTKRGERRLAGEARAVAAYERAGMIEDDMERRRIAAKRAQRIRFTEATMNAPGAS